MEDQSGVTVGIMHEIATSISTDVMFKYESNDFTEFWPCSAGTQKTIYLYPLYYTNVANGRLHLQFFSAPPLLNINIRGPVNTNENVKIDIQDFLGNTVSNTNPVETTIPSTVS